MSRDDNRYAGSLPLVRRAKYLIANQDISTSQPAGGTVSIEGRSRWYQERAAFRKKWLCIPISLVDAASLGLCGFLRFSQVVFAIDLVFFVVAVAPFDAAIELRQQQHPRRDVRFHR